MRLPFLRLHAGEPTVVRNKTSAALPAAGHFGGLALGPRLVCDEAFAFRDAAHYYYPLYKYVAGQWAAGRVPLWNPQENLGQPLLADATAAVLYPGKLVFALPLSFNTNYKLYIIGHLILAAATSYLAAQASPEASQPQRCAQCPTPSLAASCFNTAT